MFNLATLSLLSLIAVNSPDQVQSLGDPVDDAHRIVIKRFEFIQGCHLKAVQSIRKLQISMSADAWCGCVADYVETYVPQQPGLSGDDSILQSPKLNIIRRICLKEKSTT